jgi:hypothetical protein
MAAERATTPSVPAPGLVLRRGAVALALAVAANVVLVAAADAAGVAPGLAALDYGPVAVLTAVGVVGATATYAALTRLVARPDRAFVAVAGVVLLLSFVPTAVAIPASPGATTLGTVVLGVAHVPPAVAAVVGLTGRWPRRD